MLTLFLATAFAAKNVTDLYQCSALGDMPGPEDFDWFPTLAGPSLIVSADARRPGEASDRNGLWWVREGASTQAPIEGRDACSLHPHGIALATGPDGARQLYVINHHGPEDRDNAACALPAGPHGPLLDSVERFTVVGDTLRFEERIGDALLQDPNDLDVAPDGTLYISNNPELVPGRAVLTILLRQNPSTLVRYRPGQGFDVFADEFFYANGVYVAPDGAILLATYAGHLYAFDAEGNELDHTRVRGALDNFLPDERGDLWLTGHPSTRRFLGHVKDPANTTPSDIFHLRWGMDRFSVVEALYDDGVAAQAVSTAVRLGDTLLLGQVFQPGLVACSPR